MFRSTVRKAMIMLLFVLLGACTGQDSHDEKLDKEVVKGYGGGCADGRVLYVQNQFEPYGAKARDDIRAGKGSPGPTVNANKRLVSTGWYDTGEQLYPDNPSGIRGRVWYYIPKLHAWLADVSVRSRVTHPAPNNADRFFTKRVKASQPAQCQLKSAG